MIKILFVCHGNICRSPMAEFILKDMVEKRGLQEQFVIASAATSTEEIWGDRGNPVYPPAREELKRHGIGRTAYTDFSGKRAKQVTRDDYAYYDYLLCADANNIRNTTRITGADKDGKISLLLDFSENERRHGASIADPWYTGDFSVTYRDIVEGLEGFLRYLEESGRLQA
ncbi:MAG: low molecular weight protein-tyrosine-phosphatase [Eubacteriales bacterium]|nr:low molecular weight protein-tyrosine-phosphatase [Eubacteriales bacterium]